MSLPSGSLFLRDLDRPLKLTRVLTRGFRPRLPHKAYDSIHYKEASDDQQSTGKHKDGKREEEFVDEHRSSRCNPNAQAGHERVPNCAVTGKGLWEGRYVYCEGVMGCT